ncbi:MULTISPECIES: methyl-accepting chemotaxis protein [unclassified Herbaspirillum]|uniref:methyl-accepting chemotaxis protein n=1 Tax=unclassified Herbaspirillum TaxID=2624150 RepID=UPI001153E7F4|nr:MULTISPECIES: methyl-accepting chemotaxis protein [unclassified Herbaspirillum]MBB5390475.1 methyl-accepting chemotaxis protein-2 (aspartate sensor receptor) [Herbaspirillum sp. SJZ102]TQK09030.1 methyl-accepting chemotaxis protein-2 (aspartate sensor receptor) [Herbaspirillum sp. SJZ130]TQK14283.1 methyl-accepting chemotaxis protein-2 (aspartate sensor receptor) [Herbaspirillum sp. SJZ106]TWC66694.1 methyl-accepting chemotaxis protein-2 (aspartate sensor receptor) [Herbaspirillum sp. SJZ099
MPIDTSAPAHRSSILNRSVGAKLTALTVALVGAVFIIALMLITYSASRMVEQRSLEQMSNEARSVSHMVGMFDHTVTSQVDRFSAMFGNEFAGKFTLDEGRTIQIGDRATPALQNDGHDLNLDFTIPDRFTAETGVTATIFAKTGDDFVRVSTSLKKENGERAIGTLLDRAHPGYAALKADKAYSGLATLFGKQYITKYVPVKDAAGQIIGVLYVGIDISPDIKALKDQIKALRIGDTGFFYVLNGKEGKELGTMIAGAPREGKEEGASLLELKDAAGNGYIKAMLERQEGAQHYTALDGRKKIIALARYPGWNWVIAGEAYVDELTREVDTMRKLYIGGGLLFLAILGLILSLVVRRMVSRPLDAVCQAADRIAGGDLTTRLHVVRSDEIGRLMRAFNGISEGLSAVVASVRSGTEEINTAASEIAAGNLNLSARTEQQAGALEETASAMEELTSTVKQNAANAVEADQLSGSASSVASQGGEVVGQVVNTMDAINASSQRIVDIISVIDGIAFQTNILALNAAVEAARAGEQGRGFAVVATEVRTLAQRSATAAREIKELIDASVETVGSGGKLVQQAGATMGDVVASVRRVSTVISEISTASREQSEGIDQINRAIAQMDESTQQNAALVEQAAAAAQSLQQQAQHLAAAVSAFRI